MGRSVAPTKVVQMLSDNLSPALAIKEIAGQSFSVSHPQTDFPTAGDPPPTYTLYTLHIHSSPSLETKTSLQVARSSFLHDGGGKWGAKWNLHSSTLLCTPTVNSLRMGLCGSDCQWLNEPLSHARSFGNTCSALVPLFRPRLARRDTERAGSSPLPQTGFSPNSGFSALFLWMVLPGGRTVAALPGTTAENEGESCKYLVGM